MRLKDLKPRVIIKSKKLHLHQQQVRNDSRGASLKCKQLVQKEEAPLSRSNRAPLQTRRQQFHATINLKHLIINSVLNREVNSLHLAYLQAQRPATTKLWPAVLTWLESAAEVNSSALCVWAHVCTM